MNFRQFHRDVQDGFVFLVDLVISAVSWVVFIVCFPVLWPLSKLAKYKHARDEAYYRDKYGR